MKLKLTPLLLPVLMLLLGACTSDPSEADIEATVEAKVEQTKASLVAPTAVPLPTYTPYPTYTPVPVVIKEVPVEVVVEKGVIVEKIVEAVVTPTPTQVPSTPAATPSPPAVTPSPKPTQTPVPTVQPFVYWSNWETGEWTPSSTPPKCGPLEEMFDVLPIDVTIVDRFTPPGRPGGNGSYYIAHGHFRSHNTPHDQIEVKFPAEGFSLYAANRRLEDYFIEDKETDTVIHMVDDEEQVKLEFHHPCGIAVTIDHLAQVTDRWAKIIKDVPVFTNDSRVTFMPSGKYFVESGEVLAHAIGHATNTYLDFGVYDLRSKNDSAERLARDWPAYLLVASHGICWTGFFGPEVQKVLEGATADSDATSDFCG